MASQEELFDEFKKVTDRMGSTFDSNAKTMDDYNRAVNLGKRNILNMGDAIRNLGQSTKDLKTQQKDAQKEADKNLKLAKDSSRGLSEQIKLARLANQYQEQANEIQTKLTAAQGAYAQSLRSFQVAQMQKTLAEFVVNGTIAAARGQKDIYMSMINGLQQGQDGVQIASDIMLAEVRRNAAIAQAAVAAAASAAKTLGGVTPGTAAGLEIAGKVAAELAGQAFILSEDGIKVLTRDMAQTRDTYMDLTRSGAVFAGGMTEMRKQLSATGLTLGDYQTVVKNARSDLQLFGTTQVDAMARVGAVTNTMGTEVNKQMRNMGYTNAEISEGVAEYMANLARTGNLAGKSQADLARESTDYLSNMKLISAITGEDAKSAQKRARDAAMQAGVQTELAMMGGDATAKFGELIKVMPGFEKEIGQILLTGGTTNSALANSPAFAIIQDAIGKIRDQSVKANGDIAKSTQDSLYASRGALQSTLNENRAAGIGAMMGMNTDYAEQQNKMVQLTLQAQRDAAGTAKAQEELKKKTDPLTEANSNLQIATEKASIALKDTLTGAVTSFAKDSAAVMANTQRVVKTELETFIKVLDGARKLTSSTNPAITSGGRETGGGGLEVNPMNIAAADGAVLTGPASGYRPNLTMHGTEAIVPLKDGGVPVNSPEMTELIQALKTSPTGASINIAPLVEKMNENNQLLRSQVEMNRQIIDRLEAGNANTKGILSYAR